MRYYKKKKRDDCMPSKQANEEDTENYQKNEIRIMDGVLRTKIIQKISAP